MDVNIKVILSNDIYNGMPIEVFIDTLKSKAIGVYQMMVVPFW
jgi:hypothetical protein